MTATMTITGNVGAAPEAKTTRNGTSMTTFRLACTPRFLRDGEWVEHSTMWMTVYAYRALAENIATSVRKGDPVIVTGRLRLESWTGNDGVSRERQVIDATHVGHDLGFGEASFQRVRRGATSPEPAGEERPAEAAEGGEPLAVAS